MSIEDLVPSGKKLSRLVDAKYAEHYSQTVKPMISIANQNGFAITTDFAHHNGDYLAITLHFMNNAR